MGKTIPFKSTPENWEAEQDYRKRNTVRFTDDWDKARWDLFYEADHVEITNTETKMKFTRVLSHKCTYKNIVILSW
jgi:hypothetical protein